MAAPGRNKETISATVSPYIKKQVEELVASGDFSSMSDFVSIAISEFIGIYKREQKSRQDKEVEAEPVRIVHHLE